MVKSTIIYTGKVGITLNINWYDPKDDQLENIEAAERALQFLVIYIILYIILYYVLLLYIIYIMYNMP